MVVVATSAFVPSGNEPKGIFVMAEATDARLSIFFCRFRGVARTSISMMIAAKFNPSSNDVDVSTESEGECLRW